MKTINKKCSVCRHTSKINVKPDDYEAWKRGELIFYPFPYLKHAERELLLNDICGKCMEPVEYLCEA